MAGGGSSSYVLSHGMREPVPGRSHRAARRRAAQRDDRTVAPGAMDRMRLIDRPEEDFLPCRPSGWLRVGNFMIPMREHQVIDSILAKALHKAHDSDPRRVKSLQLVIGEITELDPNSIREYWAKISRGTSAERAELHFRLVKARAQCMACFMEYSPINGRIHCPYCGSYGAKILAGEEFYLESAEWDDE